MSALRARQPQQFVDHLLERAGGIDVYRSDRPLTAAVEREHELDSVLAQRPVVVGAGFEPATHRVVVNAKVNTLVKCDRKRSRLRLLPQTKSTSGSSLWSALSAMCSSHIQVSYRLGPPGRPVSGSAE